jgi:PAS domain S-box-containing protein
MSTYLDEFIFPNSEQILNSQTSPLEPDLHLAVDDEHPKLDRKERNRIHAKSSRNRQKVLLGSLQQQLLSLRAENTRLRKLVCTRIPTLAKQILAECTTSESTLLSEAPPVEMKASPLTSNIAKNVLERASLTASSARPARVLMEPDYRLVQSLVTTQKNFLLTDPSLPDNPIVYSSDGFCQLTGYKRHEILGRNCRFLQGPETDRSAVELIRTAILEGKDVSVCLLNYKAGGKPFWNNFFLAALKDSQGKIINYIGVQCEVNAVSIAAMKDRVKRLPIPIVS